jgi:sRNA-binding carbon storage regulator CsrA
MRAPLRAAGVAALLAVLAGCGQTVDSGDLTDQVSAAVQEASGSAPDGVDCPDPLDAEEGATTTCEVTVGDESGDVGVEVTGVDGDTAEFDVDVPEELQVLRVAASDVEEQITSQLAEQVGVSPKNVTCPEDLVGEEGASTVCTLEADGEEYDVAVEVTGVDGTNVNFSIEVASEPNGR